MWGCRGSTCVHVCCGKNGKGNGVCVRVCVCVSVCVCVNTVACWRLFVSMCMLRIALHVTWKLCSNPCRLCGLNTGTHLIEGCAV